MLINHDTFDGDPTYPFALHIGLRPHHLPLIGDVDDTSDGDGNVAIAYVDGDTWEEWGENVPTMSDERDYAPVFHVVIAVTSRAEGYATLETIYENGIVNPVPMRYGDRQKGTLASLTRMEEWSEELFAVKVGPADTDAADA